MERAYKSSGALMLDTDINGESILIDVGSVWGETFAKWDCLVSADLAEEIATATAGIVRRHAERIAS